MKKVFLHQTNIISPLGFSTEENFRAVCAGNTAIQPVTIAEPIGTIYAGKIKEEVFAKMYPKMSSLEIPRIEKYILAALEPLVAQRGISEDSLLIISTTKGNISALEKHQIEAAHLGTTATYIQNYFGFAQKPLIISNACVSGVMALSVAKRLIQMEQASEIYVVAFDELVPFIISGFQSLQAMSDTICKPYDI